MRQALKLGLHRLEHPWVAVADVQDADAADEVKVRLPINISDPGAFGLRGN
jgi:hypothetical protein